MKSSFPEASDSEPERALGLLPPEITSTITGLEDIVAAFTTAVAEGMVNFPAALAVSMYV